ncbi:hypothetical protein QQS21_001991 [Conoideocrella luteorostrata]|uniref:Uncharacterized protein n=1 Tax=Conoideocrella luteorostrata TaxID=1105319 RepID=A0AAJ0CW70_9HYPO|nr:hypothetical protein QQS21_001991 [Conoideocrella luteorostrata]
MTSRADWLRAKVAPTRDALVAGDGCHADEAEALNKYLDGGSSAHEAANAFTKPVLEEGEPSDSLYRPMALLCEALVELENDRDKLLDLLATMEKLPSAAGIDWSELPGFGNMWSDLYRLYTHGPDHWETSYASLSEERVVELRQHYRATAAVEAEMYLRGLDGITAHWGYETLNLICTRRAGLEVLISSMHVWLTKGSTRLKEDLDLDELYLYGGTRRMEDHWETWRSRFLEVSKDEGFLSQEARKLAAECHEMMKLDTWETVGYPL